MMQVKAKTHQPRPTDAPRGVLSRFAACKRGASAVEFAMIASFLSIIMLNVVDIAIFMFRKMELTSAVRAGAQYALVHDAPTDANIQTVVENATNTTGMTVTIDSNVCGCADGTTITCATGSCASGNIHYYTSISATMTPDWIFLPGTKAMTSTVTIRTE